VQLFAPTKQGNEMTKSEENGNQIIAQRYADALMDCANDGLSKNDIYNQIKDVELSLNNSEDLQNVMSSPIVSTEEKKNVISKIFENNVNRTVLNFLKLLVDKNRFNILTSIVDEYKNTLDRQNGILELKLTSAIDLNDEEKENIKSKLKEILSRELELEWNTDSSIIGGLVFESGDNIVDCSLQHKLQEIQKEITV